MKGGEKKGGEKASRRERGFDGTAGGWVGAIPDERDAEVIVSWSLRPEQFKVATNLRWIHSLAAAVHQPMFPELINSDVVLTYVRDVHVQGWAEKGLSMIFTSSWCPPQSVRFHLTYLWVTGPP